MRAKLKVMTCVHGQSSWVALTVSTHNEPYYISPKLLAADGTRCSFLILFPAAQSFGTHLEIQTPCVMWNDVDAAGNQQKNLQYYELKGKIWLHLSFSCCSRIFFWFPLVDEGDNEICSILVCGCFCNKNVLSIQWNFLLTLRKRWRKNCHKHNEYSDDVLHLDRNPISSTFRRGLLALNWCGNSTPILANNRFHNILYYERFECSLTNKNKNNANNFRCSLHTLSTQQIMS